MGILFNSLRLLFIDFFANLVGNAIKKAPITAAFFAITVIIIGTYIATMHTIVVGLNVAIPATVLQVWGWVMPSNMTLVLSAIYGSKITKWVHMKTLEAMKIKRKSLTS